MLASEALSKVEDAAYALELSDANGERLNAIEAIAKVRCADPHEWEHIELGLQSGEMSPEEYYRRATALFSEFRRGIERARVEQKLAELMQAQAKVQP